jgi:molybdopterin-guanine dinucleotide biosynthesis protein A
MIAKTSVGADLAAIFAGGAALRMGGADKGAVLLAGKPLHQIVAARLAPQARALAVLAPQAPGWLASIPGSRWLPDIAEAKGPAAGLLSALRCLEEEQGGDALLLTAPVDAPFLPEDLFEKLQAAMLETGAPAAVARRADGLHPVFGLWRASCAASVDQALRDERALHRIATKAGAAACEGWTGASPDPFTNLNTLEDVAAAETLLRSQRS